MSEEQEREQYAQHLAVQQRIAAWLPEGAERGHRPALATRKRGGALVAATDLRIGDRVRVRYLDYDAQRNVIDFAGITHLEHDPGCPWHLAWPRSVWTLVETPDGLPRWLIRLGTTEVVETDTDDRKGS